MLKKQIKHIVKSDQFRKIIILPGQFMLRLENYKLLNNIIVLKLKQINILKIYGLVKFLNNEKINSLH